MYYLRNCLKAFITQAPALVEAALAYMVEDLVPNRPAACFELGMRLYPHLGIQGTNPLMTSLPGKFQSFLAE